MSFMQLPSASMILYFKQHFSIPLLVMYLQTCLLSALFCKVKREVPCPTLNNPDNLAVLYFHP